MAVPTIMTPGHKISIRDHDALVEVRVDGHTLASTRNAKVLIETGLPLRYYIPRADVVATLSRTETGSHCPFKGDASYWSVRAGDAVMKDVAWSYEEPIPDAKPIAGRVAFFNERVDIVLDGAVQERPRTPWS
ncbi:MAG: DUF427 domain-containing protein [Actinobacteria bacterium]|nr:DUF427 domain-containing protein [Actinomycetota bacterium]